MSVEDFYLWRSNPPPKDTVVFGSYDAPFDWRLYRTCKRGCCVRNEPDYGFGCLINPRYWKPVEEK